MRKNSIVKTALIALVAIVMFVGCEPSVVGPTKFVSSADIVQNGVFLEGQDYDASKFSVVVKYTDNTSETLNGVNVYRNSSPAVTGGVKNGEKIAAVAGVNLQGEPVIAEGALVAYSVDSLTVTAPESVTSTNRSQVVADTSTFIAVANYRDSQGAAQTLALVNGADFTVSFESPSYEDNEATTGTATYNVTLKFGTYSNLPGSTGTVAVTRPATAAEDYSTYEWTGKVVYAQVPASSSVKYFNNGVFDGEKMVEVYKVYTPAAETTSYAKYYLEKVEDGLKYTLTSPLAGDGNENRFAATGTEAAFAMTYTYVADEDAAYGLKTTKDNSEIVIGSIDGVEENADGKLVSTNEGTTWYDAVVSGAMKITDIKADYITSIKAESLMARPYLVGWQAADNQFKVTATYASGIEAVLVDTDYAVDNTALTAGQTSVKIKLEGTALTTAEKYGAAPETTGAVQVQAEDYPTSITAAWKTSAPTTAGVTIDKDSFNFTITWASNKTYNTQTEGNKAEDMPEVSYSISPASSAVGKNDVKIGWSCNGVSGTIAQDLSFTVSE